MLQPNNRLTLIDAMRPPSGFGFESAMGVTFTLDLRALLAAPAAFALTGSDSITDDGTQYEPIELLHAVRTHAGKVTVFSQVGEIALPPSRRVFAFLERSVIPVRAPLGGVVHPKAWVLRYEALDDPREQRLRVLIASRNLTFDASWDTLVRLDESVSGRGVDLGVLGDLFEGLMSTASTVGISPDHAQRVTSLSSALRAASFALPRGVDEIHLYVLGLTRTPSPLPLDADRSLIISPFLGGDFFTRVRPASVDELVSRAESLDLLDSTALGHVGSAYAFDDGSSADLGSAEERLSPSDPGRPLVGLHAKVFAFEISRRARLFLGSPNATGAAFSRNVEILVELAGSVENLGIDRLADGTAEEPGLRSLFTTYTRFEPAAQAQEVTALDRARHAIAGLAIGGFVEESGTGWAVTYRSPEPVRAVDRAAIHCWPLASSGNRRRVAAGEPLDVRFETTLETISGFLAFEIRHGDGTRTEFVVPVSLRGVPEQRERVLLRALVGNAERFLRYVLALLDEDPTQMDFLDALDGERPGGMGDGLTAAGLPVLEKLLRTMRRDPAKLAALHPLVSDLAADDALPPGFAELWAMIYDVAVTGAGRR
jgi:hypothetical protein